MKKTLAFLFCSFLKFFWSNIFRKDDLVLEIVFNTWNQLTAIQKTYIEWVFNTPSPTLLQSSQEKINFGHFFSLSEMVYIGQAVDFCSCASHHQGDEIPDFKVLLFLCITHHASHKSMHCQASILPMLLMWEAQLAA